MEDLIQESVDFANSQQQQPLFDLTELTVKSALSIKDLRQQLKTTRDMVKDVYVNNETYKMQEENVKEVKRVLTITKEQINSQPAMNSLLQKKKDLAAEIKEKENAVSDYALQVSAMTGADQIERDGSTYDIVKTAKLVKRLH